ncbi:MAG TPA: CoA ester lyase [Burkholderiales bacterium]|nr:CoA ester lyase [Burkholderiales bacterium]
MSFTPVPEPTARLHRSELYVPGTSPALFEKAARSAADVVTLDLEDAVAPEDKERARRDVVAALNDIAWGERSVAVRVNGLDTHWMYRDVIELVENCPRLDLLVIPKVGVAADVYALDLLVTQIERARGRERRVGLELIVETALGLSNVEAIAAASRRAEAIAFGAGDFAATLRAPATEIGALSPDYGVLGEPDTGGRRAFYPGDPWHAAQLRIAVACRAHGLRPVDGAYADFRDAEGYIAAARRAAALGYEGKYAIHPAQVELANRVFTPAPETLARARRVVEAMERAAREGRAAVQLDGRMVDIASVRMAQQLLERARRIEQARKP